MTTIGRIKNGDLLISGEINERLPAVTSGLVSYFPFDGTAFDSVGGNNPIQTTETNRNLLEMLDLDWRNPSNWTVGSYGTGASLSWDETEQALVVDGYGWWSFNGFIGLDPSKSWYIEATMKKVGPNGAMYFGDISYDSNKAETIQHPGSYEYFGANGVGVPSTWTVYKNSAIGGSPRTATSTTQGDQSKFDPNCAYIRPMFIANYTTGAVGTDKLWIKDLKFYYSNPNTSNVTMNYDGAAIEQAVTNLCPDPKTMPASTWQARENVTVTYNEIDPFGGNEAVRIHPNTTTDNFFGTRADAMTIGTYSVSCWLRSNVDGKVIKVVAGTKTTTGGFIEKDVTLTRKWQKVTFTGNTTAEPIHTLHIGGWSTWTDNSFDVWLFQPQVEANSFSKFFVDGTKSDAPLDISLNITSTDFTLVYKYIPDVDWINSTANKYLWYLYDGASSGKIWYSDWRSSAGSATSQPWIGFDEYSPTSDTAHFHAQSLRHIAGKEYYFALTKSGGTYTKYAISEDGYNAASITYTEANVIAFKPAKMVLLPDYNWKIRDLAFYNRALSEVEVKKIFNGAFTMQYDGDIITRTLIEQPTNIPSDALYFSLGGDAKDVNKLISPANEVNTIYKDGAVWVGSGYTNLFTCTSNGAFPVTNGKNFEVLTYETNSVLYRNYFTGESWNFKGCDIAVAASTTYQVSFEAYLSVDFNGNYTQIANIEQTGATSWSYDMSKKGTWQTFTYSFTPSVAGNSRFNLYAAPNNASATKGFVLYRNPMFVARNYQVPFINGTRNYANLNYIGADLTKNNWQEFSIVMAVKYSDLGRWRISGAWDRFYLGVNPTDNIAFSWIEGGTQRGPLGGSTAIPKNQWVMIGCSVKNNTFIDLYYNGVRELNSTAPFQMNSTAMNFELNSLAPNDTSYPLNAWVKDFIIIPRALTQTEMAAIYQNQMKSYKDKLQVRGIVFESQTLV